MRGTYKYILVLVHLSVFCRLGAQKDSSTQTIVWGHAGVLSDARQRSGFQLGFNYAIKKHLLGLRYYQSSDHGFVPFQNKTLNYLSEIKNGSLLYGYRIISSRYFSLVPMAGISFGQGCWRNGQVDTLKTNGNLITWTNYSYHYEQFSYPGLQLNLSLLWTPQPTLALVWKYLKICTDIPTMVL